MKKTDENVSDTFAQNIRDTNHIRLAGRVEEGAVFSHNIYGEDFYEIRLAVKRRSGTKDILNVTVSDRLMTVFPEQGDFISLKGQIRTYNERHEGTNRLKIVMFCLYPPEPYITDINEVTLKGFICRKPYYRRSPAGREICDIMLAVNRFGGKSDYIPCIAWGRNARYAETLKTGAHVRFSGRLQSREYVKITDDGSAITKTAFEVSVTSMELIEL